MDIELAKDIEAYKWMFTEVLLKAFNDILTIEWYSYHLMKYLKDKNKNSRKVLKRHFESINWLLTERHQLCFEILGLKHLNESDISNAIYTKIYSGQKFMKHLRNYQESKLQVKYDSQKQRCISESIEKCNRYVSKFKSKKES